MDEEIHPEEENSR